jgi:hypothetical protein
MNTIQKTLTGYHFTGATLRDGRPIPPPNVWLEHDGPVVPCQSGYHMSLHPFDALQFAPGSMVHLVELEGDIQAHGLPVDKHVGRRRKILASADAELVMREFARWCALQVIHLWDAPEIVKRYLETGDEVIRDAARDAAWVAARVAAWDAAWVAAWDAARDAARVAARVAARDAQRDKFRQLIDMALDQHKGGS